MNALFTMASHRNALYGDAVLFLTDLYKGRLDEIADDPYACFDPGKVAAGVAEVERVGKALGIDPWAYWTLNATVEEFKRLRELTQ